MDANKTGSLALIEEWLTEGKIELINETLKSWKTEKAQFRFWYIGILFGSIKLFGPFFKKLWI